MYKMKKLALAALILLAACRSSMPTYAETLQPWIGQSEEKLLQAWGAPHRVLYLTQQQKVWIFLEVSSKAIDGRNNPYSDEVYYPAVAMPDFGFPSQPQYTVHYCKTLFTITNDIVTNFSFNGDDCVVNKRE